MKMYLMRHGETDYNQRRCFYGSHDVSINEKGIRQAQEMGKVISSFSVDYLVTSALKRTHETANLVFPNRAFQVEPDFNEKDFGLWEGLTADEIQDQYPTIWQSWLEAPFEVTPPEAESFRDFQYRVKRGLDNLLSRTLTQDIAIIAHLGVLRLIYQYLIDPSVVFWDIDFPQGTVTCFEQTEKHWKTYLLEPKETIDDSNT